MHLPRPQQRKDQEGQQGGAKGVKPFFDARGRLGKRKPEDGVGDAVDKIARAPLVAAHRTVAEQQQRMQQEGQQDGGVAQRKAAANKRIERRQEQKQQRGVGPKKGKAELAELERSRIGALKGQSR